MMKMFMVIVCTAITYYVLITTQLKKPAATPVTLSTKLGVFFFLLVIFVGLFYWLDVGAALTTGGKAGGGGAGAGKGEMGSGESARDMGEAFESNLVSSIREEVDVGITPFRTKW